jgi:hypothetical protein
LTERGTVVLLPHKEDSKSNFGGKGPVKTHSLMVGALNTWMFTETGSYSNHPAGFIQQPSSWIQTGSYSNHPAGFIQQPSSWIQTGSHIQLDSDWIKQ